MDNINKMATELVTKVLSNEETERCGEIYYEYLLINVKTAFSGTRVVVVDKVVLENNCIVVYDEDGGIFKWDELYTNDKALLAHTIYSKFQEEFMKSNFDVLVEGKSITPELVDYLTAYELKEGCTANGYTNVVIDEN